MYDMIDKFFWQGRGEIFFDEKNNLYLTPIAASKTAENSYAVKNSKHEIRKLCRFYTDDISETIEQIIKEAEK